MNDYNKMFSKLKTYQPFIAVMNDHASSLQSIKNELDKIEPNKVNIKKFKQIGHVMKCFYQLYKNKDYYSSLKYSFGFNGYLDNLRGLKENITNANVAACKIIKNKNNNNNNKNNNKNNKNNNNNNKPEVY